MKLSLVLMLLAAEPTPQEVCAKEGKQACFELLNISRTERGYWCAEECPAFQYPTHRQYRRLDEPKDGGQ